MSSTSRLSLLRRAAGLTQQQLADAAGINIRRVQKYEDGEAETKNMTLGTAAALAKALGAKPEDLLK